jgi:hypothetical protein
MTNFITKYCIKYTSLCAGFKLPTLVVICFCLFVCLVVFNPTFNNISVILWQSFLLAEETWGPGENHDLSHNVVHLALIEIQTINGDRHYIQSRRPLVVIGIDCIGSCKSNYHTIMNAPFRTRVLISRYSVGFQKLCHR